MKKVLVVLSVLLVLCAPGAAQICPATPEGYVRQHRPEGEPANYPPIEEPACYMIGTQEAANYASCILCHGRLA